jgi:hypothetical protein
MKDPNSNADEGLNVIIATGRLQISVGINALCHALQYGQYFDSNNIKITDEALFAREVLGELLVEEEDGSTLVHRMLDKAAERAYENGAEGADD